METAAGTRHGLHSTPARTPRNAKSGKCDESGMGRDESGKSIGHLAKAGRIEPIGRGSPENSVAVRGRPIPPRCRTEIGQPVQEVTRREFDVAVNARPRPGPTQLAAFCRGST
jgi:hypothetical protein